MGRGDVFSKILLNVWKVETVVSQTSIFQGNFCLLTHKTVLDLHSNGSLSLRGLYEIKKKKKNGGGGYVSS